MEASIQLIITRTVLLIIVFAVFVLFFKKGWFHSFAKETVHPINLSVFRILFFGFFLFHTATNVNWLWQMVEPWKDLSIQSREKLFFPGSLLHHLPVTDDLIIIFSTLWITSCFTATIGFFSRISAGVFTLSTLYLFSIPQLYGKINHYHYFFWIPAILTFSPCGDFLSIDYIKRKYLFKEPLENNNNLKYSIPLKTIWILFGIIYFFPGFKKFWDMGIPWIFSDHLQNNLYLRWSELDGWLPAFRPDRYSVLMRLGAAFTILFELSFTFLILKKKTRWMAIAAGVFFHTGTYVLMQINFFLLVYYYTAMVDWGGMLKKLNLAHLAGVRPMPNLDNQKIPFAQSIVSVVFIGTNLLHGVLNINSWPFSIYPTFSSYVAPVYTAIYYRQDSTSHEKLKSELLTVYPAERLRALENRVIWAVDEGDTVKARDLLEDYVSPWVKHSQILNEGDTLSVWLVNRPLNPDSSKVIRKQVHIKHFHKP